MSQPMQPFESQNVRDDDGAVLDSLFIETDSPPDLKELNEPILVKYLQEPVRITRIISGDTTIRARQDVFQLLQPDANRKSLQISVYSPTAVLTDGVRISDDNGMVYTAGKVLHNGTIPLDQHTGPIYVQSCGQGTNGAASADVSIEYWSVTC